MRKIGFKQKYLIFIVTICLVGVSLYYSYAFFVTKQLQENVVVLKTQNNHDITFGVNGKNSIIIGGSEEKVFPMTIHNSSNSIEYYYEIFFKSVSGVKISSEDNFKGLIKTNEVLTININVDNSLNTNEEVIFDVVTSSKNNYVKEIGYGYINQEKSFDHSGANKPILDGLKLIPVAYDKVSDEEGYWYKTDVNNQQDLWYDYNHGIWANAILVTDDTYKKYQKSNIGEEINASDILGFYVWIPRFKYVVTNSNNYTNYENLTNIIFEKETDTTGTITCKDDINNHLYSEVCEDLVNGKIYDNLSTYTHPAFLDKQGFWVSKFLMSNENPIKAIPNNNILKKNIVEAIELSEKMINHQSHLLTNMEYASIVLLSNSMYGKSYNENFVGEDNYLFKKIYANSYVGDLAGCSTEYSAYSKNINTGVSNECLNYNNFTNYTHTSNGLNYLVGPVGPGASSTGTIYGVYDLASRSGELVSAVSRSKKDLITTEFIDIYSDNNYVGIISSSKSIANLYRYKLGDAIRENMRTISENGMYMNGRLEQKTNGVLVRGGNGEMKNASVYTSSMQDMDSSLPFRVVINYK